MKKRIHSAKDVHDLFDRIIPAVFLLIFLLLGLIIFTTRRIYDDVLETGHRSAIINDRRIIFIMMGIMTITLGIMLVLYIRYVLKARQIVLREQDETQHSKDELLSLASHQLRTPATAVKQYLGMIIEGYTGDVTSEQLKVLKKAYSSNERQIETINQILYVTKADAGRLELQKSYFNINQLIEEVINDMSTIIKERRQKIVFKPNYVNTPIYADKHCLRIVIENLLTNASKYTHPGGKILIKTGRKDDLVILSVTDNGVGIKFEDRDKLFKKFSRIDNELSIKAGGSGIGLFLDKVLVELHGGHIKVISQPQEGTTFTIYLPIKHAKVKLRDTK
jgi:signal transduction histidine kinase